MKNVKEIVEQSRGLMPEEFTEQLSAIVNTNREAEFKVPILGGMKAGKSTLLARMMECEQAFLPPDNLEATAKTVRISYGFVANRKIVHTDGTESLVESDEEWEGYARGKTALNAGVSLVVELPNEFLRDNRVSVYDTPGNNSVDEAKAEETWSSLIGSQFAVYCVRATEILTKTDITFLKSALPLLKNFVIAVTRLDEAGIHDIHSAKANEMVEYVRSRLSENFSEQPLAIIPVCSVKDGDNSGISLLNRTVENILKQRGDDLRSSKIDLELRSLAKQNVASVCNKIELIERLFSENGNAVAEKIGTFKSQLVEMESEKSTAVRRLQVELDSKKQNVRSAISECGIQAVDRIKNRLESFNSSRELEEASQGILLSEVSCWHDCVGEVMESLANSNEDVLANAASEFVNRIESSVKENLDVNFKIVLSDRNNYEVPVYMKNELERLGKDSASINEEIASLQEEMKNDCAQIPEIQGNLEIIRSQLDQIGEYQPQYIQKKYGSVYGETEDALKNVGTAIDWILMLAPIPMGKLKWLSKFKYGKKIQKVVKQANKMIRAKNKFIKNVAKPVPGLGRFLDTLSVEHWAGKLGALIDNSNTRVVMEEDPEVKKAYQAQVAPYLNQERTSTLLLNALQESIKEKQQLLEIRQKEQDFVSDATEKLERDIRDCQRQLAEEMECEKISVGKRQLLEKAISLFQNSKSELVAPILKDVENLFAEAGSSMSSELVNRMNATLTSLREQLECTQNSWLEDKGSMLVDLELMKRRKLFLESLMNV